jgi:X-Pro dipeptidyl-peptidase C-terminal non-catalytic domain
LLNIYGNIKRRSFNRSRLVGLRFTPEEYLLLHDKYKATTCRQLSEYIRRILFEKKITVFTRNQSMDDFMTELIVLRKESGNQLSFTKPAFNSAPDEYVSDPAKPVPYTEGIHNDRTREYMIDDQRFTANRTDVLVYKTDTLTEDITLAGPLVALLKTGISTSDADFVVKLIDVSPDNFEYAATAGDQQPGYVMNGYQMLVPGDIMRGRYRNSFEKAEAFIPGKISEVRFTRTILPIHLKKVTGSWCTFKAVGFHWLTAILKGWWTFIPAVIKIFKKQPSKFIMTQTMRLCWYCRCCIIPGFPLAKQRAPGNRMGPLKMTKQTYKLRNHTMLTFNLFIVSSTSNVLPKLL